jgi:hypothetical protein
VKKVGRGRVKLRVMMPVECMARLAALVPPPRFPLLRFHGVLAPRHRWRSSVVPQPPESRVAHPVKMSQVETCDVSEPIARSPSLASGDGSRSGVVMYEAACGALFPATRT